MRKLGTHVTSTQAKKYNLAGFETLPDSISCQWHPLPSPRGYQPSEGCLHWWKQRYLEGYRYEISSCVKNRIYIFKWLEKIRRRTIFHDIWKHTKFKCQGPHLRLYENKATLPLPRILGGCFSATRQSGGIKTETVCPTEPSLSL